MHTHTNTHPYCEHLKNQTLWPLTGGAGARARGHTMAFCSLLKNGKLFTLTLFVRSAPECPLRRGVFRDICLSRDQRTAGPGAATSQVMFRLGVKGLVWSFIYKALFLIEECILFLAGSIQVRDENRPPSLKMFSWESGPLLIDELKHISLISAPLFYLFRG